MPTAARATAISAATLTRPTAVQASTVRTVGAAAGVRGSRVVMVVHRMASRWASKIGHGWAPIHVGIPVRPCRVLETAGRDRLMRRRSACGEAREQPDPVDSAQGPEGTTRAQHGRVLPVALGTTRQ